MHGDAIAAKRGVTPCGVGVVVSPEMHVGHVDMGIAGHKVCICSASADALGDARGVEWSS